MKTEFLALIKFQSKIQIVWVMLFVKFLHGRWGWQGAYKGEFADDSVSFDFSDANLKFFDKSRRRNGTFFFTTQFIILNQDMEKKVQMIIIPISNLYKKNKKNIKKAVSRC